MLQPPKLPRHLDVGAGVHRDWKLGKMRIRAPAVAGTKIKPPIDRSVGGVVDASPQVLCDRKVRCVDVLGEPCAVAIGDDRGMWGNGRPGESLAGRSMRSYDPTGAQQVEAVPAVAVAEQSQRFVQIGRDVGHTDRHAATPRQATSERRVTAMNEVLAPLPCGQRSSPREFRGLGDIAVRRQRLRHAVSDRTRFARSILFTLNIYRGGGQRCLCPINKVSG